MFHVSFHRKMSTSAELLITVCLPAMQEILIFEYFGYKKTSIEP